VQRRAGADPGRPKEGVQVDQVQVPRAGSAGADGEEADRQQFHAMGYAQELRRRMGGFSNWHKINKRTGTPTNPIWFAVVFAFILGVPYLWSPVAYGAITSIAVIGLYIAHIIPIFLRLRAKDNFEVGPWNLGRKTYVIGWIATIWVVIICIMFVLPEAYPVTVDTFNYAPVAVGVVLILSGGWWLISAKNWFHGPKIQGSPEELAAIELEHERV
jgi:amino acid transporter